MLNKFKPSSPNAACRQIESQVTAYLKGGLASAQQRAFRQHLLGCDACSRLVQEARDLDADLFESARLEDRPHLSPEASAHIQERLYRRMRRALIFQRTRHMTERMVAFVAVAVLVMSALTIGRPWLTFVATSQNDTTPASLTLPVADGEAVAEQVATVDASTALSQPELVAAEPTPQPTRRPSSNQPVVANAPAEALVRSLIEAGLQNDEAQLRFLLNRSRPPFNNASVRVWQRLEWCQGHLTADDLRLRVVTPQPRLTSIYIYNGRQFLGDMKFYLDDSGDWYLSYLNYGSFSQRTAGCAPK
jgi:hypothetical protein